METYILTVDFDPAWRLVVPQVLEGESIFLHVGLVLRHHVPREGVFLVLNHTLLITCLQTDVGRVNGHYYMTHLASITLAVGKYHCIVVRD
jgi:hypothetical protein